MGDTNFKPRTQNRTLAPLSACFQNFRRLPPSFLYENPPGNIHVTFRMGNQNNGETEAISSVNKKFNFYIPGKLQASFDV